MFNRHRNDFFSDTKELERAQRRFVRNERVDEDAIDTEQIADEAVNEIEVVQEVGDVDFSESLGTYQVLLDVLYTATGDRFLVSFRDAPTGTYNEGDDTTVAATWFINIYSVDGDFISNLGQNAALVTQMTGIEQLFTAAAQDPNISYVQDSVPGVTYNIVIDFTSDQLAGTNATIDITSSVRTLTIQSIKK